MNEVISALSDLALPAIFLAAGAWYLVKSYKLIIDNDMVFRLLDLVLKAKK